MWGGSAPTLSGPFSRAIAGARSALARIAGSAAYAAAIVRVAKPRVPALARVALVKAIAIVVVGGERHAPVIGSPTEMGKEKPARGRPVSRESTTVLVRRVRLQSACLAKISCMASSATQEIRCWRSR